MKDKYPSLFSPIKIGKVEIKNRFAMMPMGVFSQRMMNQDGSYSKDGADYYIERAKGGTGLIITGLVPAISWLGFPHICTSPETYIENQKYLVEGIHKYDSKVFIQITAISGRSSPHPGDPAPSVLPMVWDPTKTSREMTKDEIKHYIESFAKGASYAKEAGIDGVEVHAVHEGYLLDQFTISNFNHRTDEYGGSLENRLRFPIEILQAIKQTCGNDYPVSLRYSVRSYTKGFNRGALPGEDYKEFGRDLDESRLVAKMLVDAGYDMLNCDNGTYDAWYWSHPPTYMPEACNLADVREIKKVVDVPVICAGKFYNPDVAEAAIAKGEVDMMGIGRPLLADPMLPQKIAEGRQDDIRPCIGCHLGCLSRIFQPPLTKMDISCAVNPVAGRERTYQIKPAKAKKKIAVVGGGIAGMEAARVSTLRGHEVTLYEKTGDLGGVFVAAASFDFKDEDKRLLKWYRKQMSDLGINIKFNREFTDKDIKGYDEIFVATGATECSLNVPGLDIDKPNVICAVQLLLGDRKLENKNVVIIGGGLTGCEIAYDLSKNGCNVTIVEKAETILNMWGINAANYNMLVDMMEYHKVKIIRNAEINKYEKGVAYVTETLKNYPNAAGRAAQISGFGTGMPLTHEIPADHIIISIGYVSKRDLFDKIKADNVHLLGDAKKPGNVMGAIWDAHEKAMNI